VLRARVGMPCRPLPDRATAVRRYSLVVHCYVRCRRAPAGAVPAGRE
jgi:hypothetical protein